MLNNRLKSTLVHGRTDLFIRVSLSTMVCEEYLAKERMNSCH